MGLRLGDQNRLLLPLSLLLAAMLFAVFDDLGQAGFRLDRAALAEGEWYRLLTGHLVHLSHTHLALNIAGLALVWVLVGRAMTLRGWLLTAILSIVAIDLGLLLGVPSLDWYVGLSGLLHGLLAAGLVASWPLRRPELMLPQRDSAPETGLGDPGRPRPRQYRRRRRPGRNGVPLVRRNRRSGRRAVASPI